MRPTFSPSAASRPSTDCRCARPTRIFHTCITTQQEMVRECAAWARGLAKPCMALLYIVHIGSKPFLNLFNGFYTVINGSLEVPTLHLRNMYCLKFQHVYIGWQKKLSCEILDEIFNENSISKMPWPHWECTYIHNVLPFRSNNFSKHEISELIDSFWNFYL